MKPDKTFLGALAALVILSIVFLIVERFVGRGCKQPIIRRGWWTDVIYWFTTILLTKPAVRLMLLLPLSILLLAQVTSTEMLKLGGYIGYGPVSRQPIWLQAIQIYLLVDSPAIGRIACFTAVVGGRFMRCITVLKTSTG